jgi:hypothetical protein
MNEIDWRDIDERHLEAYRLRVALVETLLDEGIDEAKRMQVRRRYIEEHGVSERTIRNYLRRYRQGLGILAPNLREALCYAAVARPQPSVPLSGVMVPRVPFCCRWLAENWS